MNEEQKILQKIKSNKDLLEFRFTQLSCAKQHLRFYYTQKIGELRYTLRDLEGQLIFVKNCNKSSTIDLHGATRYFVDTYLVELFYYKLQFFGDLVVMTGKGTKTLFNHVKKYLTENEYTYEIKECSFYIDFTSYSNN